MLDEPVCDCRYRPRLSEKEVLDLGHDRQQCFASDEAQLARHVHLQIGNVVDVWHAADPLHEEAHGTQRQRLRLYEHPVRLRTDQCGHSRRGSEAEVIHQSFEGGVPGCGVQPRATNRDVVDDLTHPPPPAVLGEHRAARVIRHSGEHLHLDVVAPKLADKSSEAELWRAELRSVVLRQDEPSLALRYHEIPEYRSGLAPAGESRLTRSITCAPLSCRTASLNSCRLWVTTTISADS